MIKKLYDKAGIILIVFLFFAAGIMRLNDISLYSPDSTWYVILGNSIAHGKGFLDDTKPYPDRNVLNAPLYPVLISPVELFFPRSLVAAKVWTLCWGCAALVIFYAWLARRLGKTVALAGSILFGCNAAMFVYSSEALSEAAFVMFLLLILYLFDRAEDPSINAAQRRAETALLLLLVGLTPLLREVGAAIVLSSAIFLLLRRRWKEALALIVVAGVLFGLWFYRNNVLYASGVRGKTGNLLLLFQHFTTSPTSSMTQEFMTRIAINLKAYGLHLGETLFFPSLSSLIIDPSALYNHLRAFFEGPGRVAAIILCIPFLLIGIREDLRSKTGASLRLLILASLLGAIAVYTVNDTRFLIPLLPLMIYYFLLVVLLLLRRIPEAKRAVLIPIGAIVLMVPNYVAIAEIISSNMRFVRGPLEMIQTAKVVPSIFSWPWSIIGNSIRANTPENTVFACPIKDLALEVGNRKVIDMSYHLTLTSFESILRENHVQYLVTPIIWGDMPQFEFQMRESRRFHFTKIGVAANVRVYRVESRYLKNFQPEDSKSESFDTSDAVGFLRLARQEFLRDEYDLAVQHLLRAHDLAPIMEDPVFALVENYVMLGDSSKAGQWYHYMFSMPQNLAYTVQAANLLHALELEQTARKQPMLEFRAMDLLGAARLFWDNGYYSQALKLSKEVYAAGPDYFTGLLWCFHFNLEMGDTASALNYLSDLKKIDSTNVVVRSFSGVIALSDSIHACKDSVLRSTYYLTEAAIYRQMELPDESIDRAELSLREDPAHFASYLFLGDAYNNRSRYRTAEYYYRKALELQPSNSAIASKLSEIGRKLANI